MKRIFFAIAVLAGLSVASQPLPGERMTVRPAASFELRSLPVGPYLPAHPEKKPSPNQADSRLHYRAKSPERQAEKLRQQREQSVTPVVPVIIGNASNSDSREQLFESPCVSYRGMQVFGLRPPDVTSAVGPDHIMLADNDSFRVIKKDGSIVRQEKHAFGSGFWSAADTTNLFDPKLTYDALSHRWIFVICADPPQNGVASTTSSFIVGVSASYDAEGGWFVYHIDADANNDQWFDYPSVGFNRNWIVITGNMFSNPGMSGANECRTFVFNKQEMYAGATVGITFFNAATEHNTICPALTYDANENDLWCATNDNTDDNDIRYYRISGTAAAPTMTEQGFISITGNWGTGGVNLGPQSGNSATIHAGDHDVLSAVFRGGRLYTAQTIFTPAAAMPTTCTMQLIACTPGTATVHEALRFPSSTTSMYAFPNLAITANGDWVISCAKFTNTTFPSAAVLVRRTTDPTFYESVYKPGEDWYVWNDTQGRNRWGDYSGCMVDPMDDRGVWVSGEYSIPRTGNAGNWGTWLAKICSGICAIDAFMTSQQPAGTIRKFEASNTVYANTIIHSGAYIKLDGGSRVVLQPGFRANTGSKLKAIVEGCGGAQ